MCWSNNNKKAQKSCLNVITSLLKPVPRNDVGTIKGTASNMYQSLDVFGSHFTERCDFVLFLKGLLNWCKKLKIVKLLGKRGSEIYCAVYIPTTFQKNPSIMTLYIVCMNIFDFVFNLFVIVFSLPASLLNYIKRHS